jgi:hypothetical protein
LLVFNAAKLAKYYQKVGSVSMSLNTIQLQDFIVGELYKDTLLVSSDGAPAARRPVPTPLPAVSAAPPPESPPAAPAQPTAPSPPPSAAPQPSAPYKTLGNHRRKITILVNTPGSPFLPDNQLGFLTKILEACRLNMGDVAIVNHASAPVNIITLRAQLQPSVILLFGLEPTTIRLPINFPVFKLQPYDQCTYLSAPALDLLVQTSEESKLLKSKLWLCLKSLFHV